MIITYLHISLHRPDLFAWLDTLYRQNLGSVLRVDTWEFQPLSIIGLNVAVYAITVVYHDARPRHTVHTIDKQL